ncbi:MAG: IscS subfamily cysteine desulfurase [Armatimonadetes bacterium]|nr:IscS subfamily cysteine desulfurase [Armatimonadota bacterium]
MKLPIYMDNHATTPVDPRVLEGMLPYFTHRFGNAASRNHVFGWDAEEGVDRAREQIAALINGDPKEMVFTSGATESDNLALKGVAEMYRDKGDHIITSVIEHKAVLDTCKRLEKWGCRVTYLPVDDMGLVHPDQVAEAITDRTILVSVMYANNEIGTIQPIAEIGALCHQQGVLFHTDATQGFGKIPIDVHAMNIDLLSCSAHKIYGPKGVGALWVRKRGPRVRLAPQMDGGGHERGMRSGTLNVPGIVGFGKAAELCGAEMEEEARWLTYLRDRLRQGIMGQLDEVFLNGHPKKRLSGNLNLSFAYVEGESLLMGLKDVALSSGSACTSASLEPSYVLKALGVGEDLAHSSIRYGLGRFNTEEEVDYASKRTVETVNRLREMSPLYELAKEGVDLKSVAWVVD